MCLFSGNALGTKQSQGVFEKIEKNTELGASGDERFSPSSKVTEIQGIQFPQVPFWPNKSLNKDDFYTCFSA